MPIRVPSKQDTPSLISKLFTFNDDDLTTIRNYLVGGASLGAGAGLITSYVNYLNRLKKRKDDEDDDTLYVYKKASAGEDSYLATPIALAGGTLTTLASYALIKKLYTKLRLKEAQNDLDNAQHAFIDSSGYAEADKLKNKPTKNKSAVKVASTIPGRNITATEALLSTPVLVPMLSALGASIIAYKMMDKQFPSAVKKVKGPRRIEVIEKPDNDQEEYEKHASAEAINVDGIEHLIRMTLLTKTANSDLDNLVAAAATGELEAFEKAAADMGFVDALNTVKGASDRSYSPLAEHLAICTLAKTASINEQVGLLAAAEFAEYQSSVFKQAAALDEETQDCLYKAACCFGRATRYELSSELGIKAPTQAALEKVAATLDDLGDISTGHLMSKLLRNVAIQEATKDNTDEPEDKENKDSDDSKKVESGDFSDASETSGEETGINDPDSPSRRKNKDKVKFISNTKSRRGFLSKIDSDVIDQILAP